MILFLPVVFAVIVFLYMRTAFVVAVDPKSTQKVLFEVSPGMSFSQVCSNLEAKKLIRHGWAMVLRSKFSKSDRSIKTGEYELSPAMSPSEIMNVFRQGRVYKRKVLVKEGNTVWDVAAEVERAGLLKAQEFNKAAVDPALLAMAGISATSFEGYLFPETYFFSRPVTVREIIWRMLEEGENKVHWNEDFTRQAAALQMGRHEVLTLASIVEKETSSVEEQPLIASVFHNRIARGMKLQADPTVIYGLTNFNGNLTKEDLNNPHPYNTYIHPGLPPGPICNPGMSAVRATLYPEKTTYLYFVADGRGKHIFSSSYEEHRRNVAQYQSARLEIEPELLNPQPGPSTAPASPDKNLKAFNAPSGLGTKNQKK
jgi:UPF0755 protein